MRHALLRPGRVDPVSADHGQGRRGDPAAAAALVGRVPAAAGSRRSPTRSCAASACRQKIAYLRDLARVRRLPLRRSRLSDEAVIGALTQVKGIGRWTAEMLPMFRQAARTSCP
jgi:3-methyladenine DNA glycosylase/8-oxoguanine DNA glycosylase